MSLGCISVICNALRVEDDKCVHVLLEGLEYLLAAVPEAIEEMTPYIEVVETLQGHHSAQISDLATRILASNFDGVEEEGEDGNGPYHVYSGLANSGENDDNEVHEIYEDDEDGGGDVDDDDDDNDELEEVAEEPVDVNAVAAAKLALTELELKCGGFDITAAVGRGTKTSSMSFVDNNDKSAVWSDGENSE